jgi:hypothetical protein
MQFKSETYQRKVVCKDAANLLAALKEGVERYRTQEDGQDKEAVHAGFGQTSTGEILNPLAHCSLPSRAALNSPDLHVLNEKPLLSCLRCSIAFIAVPLPPPVRG